MEDLWKEDLAINFANLEPEVEKQVREFIRLDRMIDEMKDELKVYTGQRSELEEALIPIVAEAEEQKVRIKEGIVEYSRQERHTQSYKAGLTVAMEKVNQATRAIIQKAIDATKKVKVYERLTVKQEGIGGKIQGLFRATVEEVRVGFDALVSIWSQGADAIQELALEHSGALKSSVRIDHQVKRMFDPARRGVTVPRV